MRQIITVALVSFLPYSGAPEQNLSRIAGYIRAAVKRGADLVLFPHAALSGLTGSAPEERRRAAQELAALTRELSAYVVFGAVTAESTPRHEAVVCTPVGQAICLTRSPERAQLIDTHWGTIGIVFLDDFGGVEHAYANGARLVLNPAACGAAESVHFHEELTACAAQYQIFFASANWAAGGACILGPGEGANGTAVYLNGLPTKAAGCAPELHIHTIDLSAADAWTLCVPSE